MARRSSAYEIQEGQNISPGGSMPERDSYNDVILKERLLDSLFALNKDIPKSAIEDAFRQITIPKQVSLVENNYVFHKMISDGVSVTYQDKNGDIKYTQARIFDFNNINNNNFLAVNQFTVVEGKTEKRPDMIIFVNGLPLVLFELKNCFR